MAILGPTEGATVAAQTTGNTSLANIDTKVATAANQATGNTSLASIDGKVATATAQTTGNTSLATIATNTTGIATAANQTTTNTSLATVVTNTANTKTSVDTVAGRLPTALGAAAPASSLATTGPLDVTVTGPAAQSAINVDLLTGNVNGWYDAANFHSASIQIVAGAGISAGGIIVEQTNDTTAAAAGSTLPIQEPAVVGSSALIGAQTIAASTARIFVAPVTARYVRVRISTAFVGGTVQAIAVFGQTPLALTQVQALNPTAANLNVTASLAATQTLATVTTVGTVTSMTSGNLGIPGTIADVASAALTTSTTTAAFTPTFGTSYEVNIPVTAVSGTTPTLDVDIEESDDSGTNWFKVYSFPRITATGIYRSPKLPLTGNRVRYVQTVAGTTPSFTRAINRLQSSDDTASVRQIIDRTIVPNTLNSVTPSLNVQNCRNVQVVVNTGAITTTANAVQLEGSDDNGTTWYSIGSPLTAVASSTVQLTVNNVSTQLLRARVSTAGSGVTAGWTLIKGF